MKTDDIKFAVERYRAGDYAPLINLVGSCSDADAKKLLLRAIDRENKEYEEIMAFLRKEREEERKRDEQDPYYSLRWCAS